MSRNRCRSRTGWLLSAMVFLFPHYVLCAEPTAKELLSVTNAIRNPGKPYGVTTDLLEYRSGAQANAITLDVYTKADTSSGDYRSLVRFVAPARDADKLMLKNGNEFWFYDPSSKASVRISPQQRLLGPVSNADVVGANLEKDYTAELVGQEVVQNGDQEKRNAYKLLLSATAPDVTYERVEMWIDTELKRPIKAKFFTASMRLLKTAYYRKYRTELAIERPTETVILDGLDPKLITILRYSNYRWRDIPEGWFQRTYLPLFKAN